MTCGCFSEKYADKIFKQSFYWKCVFLVRFHWSAIQMIYSAIKTRGNIKQCNCSDMKLIVIHNKVLVHKYVVLFTFPEFGNRTRRQKHFFGTILQLWNDPASQVLYRLFIISPCIFRDENVMYKPPTNWMRSLTQSTFASVATWGILQVPSYALPLWIGIHFATLRNRFQDVVCFQS